MKEGIVELYSDADLAQMRQRIKRRRAAHLLVAAVALAACLTMIALTSTENAARMELAVIAVSTLAGWIVIYGSVFVVMAARRELRHATMLREEERQAVSGAVTVTDERVVIRRSIAARRVEVRDGEGTHRMLVCEMRAAEIAALGEATLYTVHGYVAAYEVTR